MGNEQTAFLTGEWVITAMSSQLQCLMGHRSKLQAAEETDARESDAPKTKGAVTLDLSGVESLDASGCQLLAAFTKIIRQDGYEPRIAPMPASFQELFESLGYGDAVSGRRLTRDHD